MNLPSTSLHIDVAKVGDGFVVQYHLSQPPGASPKLNDAGTVYFRSREELRAWLANAEIIV